MAGYNVQAIYEDGSATLVTGHVLESDLVVIASRLRAEKPVREVFAFPFVKTGQTIGSADLTGRINL